MSAGEAIHEVDEGETYTIETDDHEEYNRGEIDGLLIVNGSVRYAEDPRIDREWDNWPFLSDVDRMLLAFSDFWVWVAIAGAAIMAVVGRAATPGTGLGALFIVTAGAWIFGFAPFLAPVGSLLLLGLWVYLRDRDIA